ncbi:MAG: hypothetical protein AAB497_01150 [Patescibacteria group bacterium]
MAFYAKKIRYGANDEVGAYVALIAVAKKKGGKPIRFVLYRFLSVGLKGVFESVEFSSSQEKEAMEAFPFGPVVYRPIEEELEGLQGLMEEGKLPRTRISQWKMTTDWLSNVAVGGSRYPRGTWVKLRKRPYTWRKSGPRKKKKLRLKFGSLEHKLLVVREELAYHKGQPSEKRKEEEIDNMEAKESGIVAEMIYIRDKKFASATA